MSPFNNQHVVKVKVIILFIPCINYFSSWGKIIDCSQKVLLCSLLFPISQNKCGWKKQSICKKPQLE